MAGTGTPNLDHCPEDELMQFIGAAMDTPGALSVALWGNGHATPLVQVAKLKKYATLRHYARLQRKQGHIQNALDAEAKMDTIYSGLPAYAKW